MTCRHSAPLVSQLGGGGFQLVNKFFIFEVECVILLLKFFAVGKQIQAQIIVFEVGVKERFHFFYRSLRVSK